MDIELLGSSVSLDKGDHYMRVTYLTDILILTLICYLINIESEFVFERS